MKVGQRVFKLLPNGHAYWCFGPGTKFAGGDFLRFTSAGIPSLDDILPAGPCLTQCQDAVEHGEMIELTHLLVDEGL